MEKERLSLRAIDQQHKCQKKDLACQLSEHREQMCLKSLQDGEEHQPGDQLYNLEKNWDLMILKGSLTMVLTATVHFSDTNNSTFIFWRS